MNKRLNSNISSNKQKRQQELQQARTNNDVRIRGKMEKKKIDINTICLKKDLHNIINSFLRGDVFDEDIFNQFWDFHFKQNVTLMEAMTAYNNTIILLLDKIIDYNLKMFEMNKDKDRHKQNHQYKLLSEVTIQLEQMGAELGQYYRDLQVFCKPFDLSFDQIILRYRPYKAKEKADGELANDEETEKKLQLVYQEQQLQNKGEEIQLQTEEKYYRFAVYLMIVVFIGDLATSFAKFNLLDLFVNILLLFNGLFQQLLLKEDQFNNKVSQLEINYVQNKLYLNQASYNPFQIKFYQFKNQSQQVAHNFTNYAYSSMFALIFMILWDSGYLILINQHYISSYQTGNSFILGGSMWKYNRFVAYTSIFMLVLKILILSLTFKTVQFDYRKILTNYNFDLNFLRFTNATYLNQVAKGKQPLNE